MVAIIKSSNNISKSLNYNEQKCKNAKAECIYASAFLKEAKQLNFYDKLHHFRRIVSLNERTKTNTVHISLNFDPGERLSNTMMVDIAAAYMEKIGFGQQPYLVYRHHDAGHPHIHIVSTNIGSDGKAISLHNIGRVRSEPARKEIEEEFRLIKAQRKHGVQQSIMKGINAAQVEYGRTPLKPAIANVLSAVIDHYHYSSFAELNAVLSLYNVRAERGEEGSRMRTHNGVLYRVLNSNGEIVGPPIKASRFYINPGWKKLEQQFEKNKSIKPMYKTALKEVLLTSLDKKYSDINQWKKLLEKQGISMVARFNEQQLLYGVTYIDHRTKCVFKGSDLGKDYSANAIQKMFAAPVKEPLQQTTSETTVLYAHLQQQNNSDLLDKIMGPAWQPNYVPYQLKKRKKKRRQHKL